MILAEHPGCNSACRVCHYKDLGYPDQLARKERWAGEQLADWSDRLAEILPAPDSERLGYRTKSWLRAELLPESVSFGMIRAIRVGAKWGEEFVSWDGCPIHHRSIRVFLERLAPLLGVRARDFVRDHLHGVWIGSPHVVFVARTPPPEEILRLPWADLLEPPLGEVWFHVTSQVGRKTFGRGDFIPIHGRTEMPLEPGGHPIRAFRQVATTLLDQARSSAVRRLMRDEPDWILDLYCGTGEISQRLPSTVGWMGIELSSDAVAFANGLRESGKVRHEAFVGKVEHRLKDPAVRERIGGRYALYVNPPRSGLGEVAVIELARLVRHSPPTSIAYLSCSASSLARDLRRIESEGFTVESLQPYDFFPQTEHFETLALLRRED